MSVKKADHVQEELKRGNDMSRSKIDNTFMRSMEQIENLEKVFREGGLLEKAVMDIKGDIAWMKDIREALSSAYEAIQDGHQGTTGWASGGARQEKAVVSEEKHTFLL